MKKANFLFILLILSACASPQVTEETDCCLPSTLPPATIIPTPTLHPEFVELQNLIADSSENLTLLPSGQIEENGIVLPNLQVDPNGEISILLVEGENIIIDLANVTFDDGIHINGYELNENDEWVEAEATAAFGGVKVTLGEAYDDTGLFEVTSFEAGEDAQFGIDPTDLGFEPGQVVVLTDGEYKYQVVSAEDPSIVIANWSYGSQEMTWNWEVMGTMEGGNPIFDIAKTIEYPLNDVDDATIQADTVLTRNAASDSAVRGQVVSNFYLVQKENGQSVGIFGSMVTNEVVSWEDAGNSDTSADIFFLHESGEVVEISVKNFSFAKRA